MIAVGSGESSLPPGNAMMKLSRFTALAAFVSCLMTPASAWAAACSEVVLGSVISLTGQYATGGSHTRNGYEFATDRLRRAGGVRIGSKCYNLRVIYYDDESNPGRAADLARHLIGKDRVRFLLGSYSAAVTSAVAAIGEQHKVPMISPEGTGNSLYRQGYRYHFGLRPASALHFAHALDLAAKVAKSTGRQPSELKVALAFAEGPYLDDVHTAIRNRIHHLGMQISADLRLSGKLVGVREAFTDIKGTNPDVLLVSAHARTTRLAMQTISRQSVQVPMIAMTRCGAANIVGRNRKAAENVLCTARRRTSLNDGQDDLASAEDFTKAFRTHYKSYVGKPVPDQVSQAAIAIDVLTQAFQRAGSLDTEKVRDALSVTDMVSFLGRVKFDATGRNVEPRMAVRQIQNGRYVVVAPSSASTANLQWPRAGL